MIYRVTSADCRIGYRSYWDRDDETGVTIPDVTPVPVMPVVRGYRVARLVGANLLEIGKYGFRMFWTWELKPESKKPKTK